MPAMSHPRRAIAVAATLTLAVGLAACSADGPDEAREGEGLSADASIEQFQSAFEEIEPITLRFQTSGPEGSLPNAAPEAYAAAVEEWSGGKITFEWGNSNAFVPAATEWAAGLADGRIDIGQFAPYYNPDVFPQLNAATDATFLEGNRPLSTLVSTGWLTETALGTPEYVEETEEAGIHLLTLAPTANIPAIFCDRERSSLDDFSGATVSASGKGRFEQLASLGFAPQSIAFTELYEALERGIVACGSTVPSALDSIGAVPLVPHAIADPEAALVGFPIFLAVGKERWDSLPLVAQQLLFDRLDVFITAEVQARSERNAQWLADTTSAGGGIHALAPDARERLLETNDALLAEIAGRGADVDAFVDAVDRWRAIVDELYPEVGDSLQDFLSGALYDELDFQAFADRLYDDVLTQYRPGG